MMDAITDSEAAWLEADLEITVVNKGPRESLLLPGKTWETMADNTIKSEVALSKNK